MKPVTASVKRKRHVAILELAYMEVKNIMGVPTREQRLAHASKHCELWNAKEKDTWVESWRTICKGKVYMLDPVGTPEKVGFDACFSDPYDLFRPYLEMYMLTVKVNGDEMAWVIESHFNNDGEILRSYSIETFRWEEDGTLYIKTYYDLPETVGSTVHRVVSEEYHHGKTEGSQ